MKKRSLSLLMAAAFILTLGGCAADEQSSDTSLQTTVSAPTTTVVTADSTVSEQTAASAPTTTAVTADSTASEQTSAATESVQTTAPVTEATAEAAPEVTTATTTADTTPAVTTTTTAATTTAATTTTVATTTATTAATTTATTVATTKPLTTSTTADAPAPVPEITVSEIICEAEDAKLYGTLTVSENSSCSGGKVVENFGNDTDRIRFTVDIPADGMYDITFVSAGIGSYKENNVIVDGDAVGVFKSEQERFTESVIPSISLTKGSHEIGVTRSWGWIKLDCIRITAAEGISDEIYEVSDRLINANANAETKALFRYLSDSYGEYVLSGQVCDDGINGREFTAIHSVTGKYPAILGLDMMDYTPSRAALGARSHAVDTAIEFGNMGGIVTFCWHWNAPTEYLKSGNDDDNGNPRWWGGFYTRNSTFDIAKVMNGQDPEGKKAIDRDIKEIAAQLKRLEEAGVPVLWRPLHEASGGWFWWGAKGADAYKKLWIYLYEELTYKYGCNNLIWVFNAQNGDWYPGDQYVDIIGEDIYPGQHVYSPQTARFTEATEYTDTNKIIALTENGCIFDIDQAVAINSMWLWFCTWGGEFAANGYTYSEKFTEAEILKKAYDSEYVITFDELPDIY